MNTKSILPCIIAGAAGAIVATVLPAFIAKSKADTKLLPFQGRLTDAAGNAVGDGARVVEFKMYDAPTGGNVKWAGEVHKLSINGGLVNTMLGSKAGLGSVDFSAATFLQITVDANNDGQITAADPPLLPRQSVIPAVFAMEARSARDSQKLEGFTWNAVFDNGNPSTGKIAAGRVNFPAGSLPAITIATDNSIAESQLAPNSVGASEIKDDAVTSAEIMNGEVKTDDLATNAVTTAKLGDGAVTKAKLASFGYATSSGNTSVQTITGTMQPTDVTGLSVTIATIGRPVMLRVVPAAAAGESYVRTFTNSTAEVVAAFKFLRDDQVIATYRMGIRGDTASDMNNWIPSSVLSHFDDAPAGTHEYKVQMSLTNPNGNSGDSVEVANVKLVAYEL